MSTSPSRLFGRFLAFCIIMSLCMFSIGCADSNLPAKQKLTNKSLLKALKKTDYSSWTLYAPSDSEIVGKNIFSTTFFKSATTFPIVAVKGDQVVLLIMQRSDNSWSLLSANEHALMRKDFVLFGFTIDISGYVSEEPSVLVSFDFSSESHPNDSNNYRYNLSMWINGKDEFASLYVFSKVHELEQCNDYYSVIINDDTLIYRCHNPRTFERTDYPLSPNPVDNSLSTFDLSTLPLLPSDLMVEALIHSSDKNPINLYIQPDSESDIITTIPNQSNVLIMNERIISNDTQWYFVRYEKSLGYILCSHIDNAQ